MPSVSGKQHRFFAMASTPKGRAKMRAEGKSPPPAAVAAEYVAADKGRHFGKARKGKNDG
jgi:hypothetical protein